MVQSRARPCRRSPTSLPQVRHRPAEMARMATHWSKLVSGVGFSKGWELLALKKPPPLVPSCLMAIWRRGRTDGDGLLAAAERVAVG